MKDRKVGIYIEGKLHNKFFNFNKKIERKYEIVGVTTHHLLGIGPRPKPLCPGFIWLNSKFRFVPKLIIVSSTWEKC